MLKTNKRIEIVRSTKTWLSSMSQESCDAIFAVLNENYLDVRISTVNDLADLKSLVSRKPDLVFLGMKFIPDDNTTYSQHSSKIWITEYLDDYGIAYTGSNKIAHERSVDKGLAKERMVSAGVNTSSYFIVSQNQLSTLQAMPSDLDFPLFVKPSNRGGGLGIDSKSVVNTQIELEAKVRSIARDLGSDSLLEKYLPGREFSVAILKFESTGLLVPMPIELIAQPDEQGIRILSQQVKLSNSEQARVVNDPVLKATINELALSAFYALGGRDYGRIDIRLDEKGIPNFLEANLIPSLISGYGSFPKACDLNSSMSFEMMILNIAELAFSHNSFEAEALIETSSEASVAISPDILAYS